MRRSAFATSAAAIFTGLSALVTAALAQQQVRETISLQREYRGRPILVGGTLLLPPGTGKVPVMVLQHGSGGISDCEHRYARELLAMGVGALIIDAFTPRGIANTVTDQSSLQYIDMAQDAFAALTVLAAHPRVEPKRIGMAGWSRGGGVTLYTALDRFAARFVPSGKRFALHVALYPGCSAHHYRPKTTGAPILMLLGGADTYAGVKPCTELADKLKAEGAVVEVKIYPGAKHGFDAGPAYSNPRGENWSKCIFEEQSDGTWKERTSGAQTGDKGGVRNEAGIKQALAACMTLGIVGGSDPAAKAASIADLKAAVRKHLLE